MSEATVLPKPELVGTTEVDITVQFQADPNLSYTLEWKEHYESWETHAKTLVIPPGSSGMTKAVATPLNPGATYCVRLSSPESTTTTTSPELICDTEQVGCTPTPDKNGCCVVL